MTPRTIQAIHLKSHNNLALVQLVTLVLQIVLFCQSCASLRRQEAILQQVEDTEQHVKDVQQLVKPLSERRPQFGEADVQS